MIVDRDIDAKLDECMAVISRQYGDEIKRPRVLYDLKGHVAGRAVGTHTIRLNIDLLNDERYREDMINNTFPHEFAHIIVHQLWPSERHKPHGDMWKFVMGLLGVKPERCHNYETTAARQSKPRPRPYAYKCECMIHDVTITLHRRMLQGRTYTCKLCHSPLISLND